MMEGGKKDKDTKEDEEEKGNDSDKDGTSKRIGTRGLLTRFKEERKQNMKKGEGKEQKEGGRG